MENTLIAKLKNLVSELEEKKGPISLFALVKREEAITWDILVSGDGINISTKDDLNRIIKMLNEKFNKNEITVFSRLVLLNSSATIVKDLKKLSVKDERGYTRASNIKTGDILIKEAYVFDPKIAQT